MIRNLDAGAANGPSPRGAHSGSVVDEVLYVFGGYGGTGYARRDFNDVYALDLEEWQWQRIAPKGRPPAPRAAHSAAVMGTRIIVMGGWSAHAQFNDVYLFDTEAASWEALQLEDPTGDSGLSLPRWSHSACGVEAIPHWKMFVFGGCTGDLAEGASMRGDFSNGTYILDQGTNRWSAPEAVGDVPEPRGDTEMAYDHKAGRLVVFGGWADRWFGDVRTLEVGNVVGPPYAILNCDPVMGPITGGALLSILGIDFRQSQGEWSW